MSNKPNILVIYNPISGAKGWKDLPQIIQNELQKHAAKITWHETTADEVQKLNAYAKTKFSHLLISGGDGTITSTIAGMKAAKIKAPLILVPNGSGNLLARSLGLPLYQIRAAIRRGLKGKVHHYDLLHINKKHYGVIAAGRGFDTFLMQNTTRAMKRKWGLFAYIRTFLKHFFSFRAKPYQVTLDGKRHTFIAKTILAFNALPFGHFQNIHPNDGLLNLIVLGKGHKLTQLSGKQVAIKSKHPQAFEIDGDLYKCKTLQIEILPNAIQISH